MINVQRVATGRPTTMLLCIALLVAFASPTTALAGQDRYDQARELAFAGDREGARVILRDLLTDSPNNWDARILLGRTLAWDKRYDEARAELQSVVQAKPRYADARNALVDVELWSDHPEQAIAVLDDGLAHDPNNTDFLLKKATAQKKIGLEGDAMVTLDRLLDRDPSNERAAEMFRSLRVERAQNKFGIGYGYTDMDTLSSAWHGASAQLSRRTPIGSFAVRMNWSRRFDSTAKQFEVDGYPRIMNGLYAYVNYGYSADRLYPNHRYGAELYANLPHGIELSGGFRHLVFDNSEVTMYTGTVAKYVGNWWISLRPYITPKSAGTSQSYALTVRRYFGDRDTFVGVTAGGGSSPGELQDVTDLLRLDSRKVGVRVSWAFTDLFILKASARYGWEELINNRDRNELSFALGFDRRF